MIASQPFLLEDALVVVPESTVRDFICTLRSWKPFFFLSVAMYMRAAASDYNDWETNHGNPGWGSSKIIPLLNKVRAFCVLSLRLSLTPPRQKHFMHQVTPEFMEHLDPSKSYIHQTLPTYQLNFRSLLQRMTRIVPKLARSMISIIAMLMA